MFTAESISVFQDARSALTRVIELLQSGKEARSNDEQERIARDIVSAMSRFEMQNAPDMKKVVDSLKRLTR